MKKCESTNTTDYKYESFYITAVKFNSETILSLIKLTTAKSC